MIPHISDLARLTTRRPYPSSSLAAYHYPLQWLSAGMVESHGGTPQPGWPRRQVDLALEQDIVALLHPDQGVMISKPLPTSAGWIGERSKPAERDRLSLCRALDVFHAFNLAAVPASSVERSVLRVVMKRLFLPLLLLVSLPLSAIDYPIVYVRAPRTASVSVLALFLLAAPLAAADYSIVYVQSPRSATVSPRIPEVVTPTASTPPPI